MRIVYKGPNLNSFSFLSKNFSFSKKLFLLILSLTLSIQVKSQLPKKLQNGLKAYLTEDSARYIQLSVVGQFWARYTEDNPYTLVEGTAQSTTTDISIRRIRLVLSGSLTDRLNFFIQFGQNNLNYLSSRKAGSFFHDVAADYAIIKKKFSLGLGLNGWNGPSRFSNTSVGSILVLDPPNYQEVTNDSYDQFVRRLGFYAKGKLGKLDYRLSAGKPFVIQTTSGSGTEPINTNTSFSKLPPKFVYQGYLMYQFLDQEGNFGSGNTGSYLGKKKIFNIGAGFNVQSSGTFRYADAVTMDTVMQDIKLFAVDLFYDVPLNKATGTAFSLYSCFSSYDYGYNFIKVAGPDNPASGSSNTATAFEKANYGNAFPYLGTGNTFYVQSAYKFKDKMLGDQGTLQPYFDLQYSDYDRLNEGMSVFDVGVNWLLAGNNSKLTLNYQSRPYFAPDISGALVQNKRLGEWVLQYHFSF